jgi:hypothetical protein
MESDNIIANAVKKGQISVTPTNVVINCPIVKGIRTKK